MADTPIQVDNQPTPIVDAPRIDNPTEMVPKTQLDAVVSELKTLRQKMADKGVSTEDVDQKIAAALKQKEMDDATRVWDQTYNGFAQKHKEFHPDNDPSGLKKAALDRELQLLNRNGLTTSQEFESILEKARILVLAQHNPQAIPVRIDPSIPTSISEPRSSADTQLTSKEKSLIDSMGWTEERYLKLKAKDPIFVEQALKRAP